MRVVILGAGGVGSVVAGHLARNGVDAIMIARPGHAQAVQQNGPSNSPDCLTFVSRCPRMPMLRQ